VTYHALTIVIVIAMQFIDDWFVEFSKAKVIFKKSNYKGNLQGHAREKNKKIEMYL